jgi:hypothetical protein
MSIGVVLLLWLLPLRVDAVGFAVPVAAESPGGDTTILLLQDLTDDLRTRLDIKERVHVTLVDHNPLVMSVETLNGRGGPFVISVDREFVQELNHAEVEAAIAHELGHVWIYTHHPYLQTEQLANQIAMQVVSRETLDSVYGKVWTDGAGPLPRFPETRTAAAEDAGPQD